jgi:ComF family protein
MSVAVPPSAGCRRCRGPQWRLEGVVCLGSYEGLLREAVLRSKLASAQVLALQLGSLLATARHEQLARLAVDAVLPVPMHWRRRLRRGVNSPELLAERLAASLGVPCLTRLLVQTRSTLPQRSLSPRERRVNLRGAFRVRRGGRAAGMRLLIVDDVLTTGSTCNEAARELLAAGAVAVTAAVVARAEGPW